MQFVDGVYTGYLKFKLTNRVNCAKIVCGVLPFLNRVVHHPDQVPSGHFPTKYNRFVGLCCVSRDRICRGGRHTQRNRGDHDHQRNSYADARVGIVSTVVFRQPDHQRGSHNTKVVSRITQDMQQYSHHSQVPMIMSVIMAVTMTMLMTMSMPVIVAMARNSAVGLLKAQMFVVVVLILSVPSRIFN